MTLSRNRSLVLFLLCASALLAIETRIATLIPGSGNPELLAAAVTADLALGIPVLYYVLLARRRHLPPSGVLALFLLALAAARLIVPASSLAGRALVETGLVAVELALLGLLLIRARRIVGRARELLRGELYPVDALREALREAMGGSMLSVVLAAELSLLAFVAGSRFARVRVRRPGSRVFTYHRRGGVTPLFFMLLFLIVVETSALHLFIRLWNDLAAWIATGLSVYTLLWMVGHYRAIVLQPVVVEPECLHLRAGLLWRADIPTARIAEVRKMTPADRKAEGFVSVAVLGEPRLVVRLEAPVVVSGLFGRWKEADAIGVTVDDEAGFLEAIEERPARP